MFWVLELPVLGRRHCELTGSEAGAGPTRSGDAGEKGVGALGSVEKPLTLPAPQCVSCTFTPTVCPSPAATAASATWTGTGTT